MRKAPRVAVVAPYLPAPASSGGRIRVQRLSLALARRASVDLYARCFPVELRGDPEGRRSALEVFRTVTLVDPGRTPSLPPWLPRRVREACPSALGDALARAHGQAPYDAVVVAHAYAYGVVAGLRGARVVLDEHNIESAYARDVVPGGALERWRLQRWERRCWARASAVTAVTEDDRAVVAPFAREAHWIPNGTDVAGVPFRPPSERSGATVLFVGALSHPPNVRAAMTLVTEVLPRVRERVPEARVVLCGRDPSREVLALAGEGVTVTGTVPEVGPYLSAAAVFANLLEHGGGSSLKVPEALAAGLPMVSTAVGVRGLRLPEGAVTLVGSAPEAADALVRALRDRSLDADARARAGRDWAEGLAWERVGETFTRVVLGDP
ncbi:MAG: glycosyltransferase [Deltaproteobacteria bacterium]|nr:glycosyltransferase [Deltaproteobacteria bacterium]